jgi:hypothetical protein
MMSLRGDLCGVEGGNKRGAIAMRFEECGEEFLKNYRKAYMYQL